MTFPALTPGLNVIPPGQYGDVKLFGLKDVTIQAKGASCRTFWLSGCENVTVEGLSLDWSPKAGDTVMSMVVRVYDCDGVRLNGLTLRGEPVPEGFPKARLATESPPPGQNALVAGYYAGRAIVADRVKRVSIRECDISGFFSGITMSNAEDSEIVRNDIHHLRTTPIKGGSFQRVRVAENHLHHMTPWRYEVEGKRGGDHFDFIHFITHTGKPPTTDVEIVGNLMDAGDGADAIAVLLGDNGKVGHRRYLVSHNVILTGNTQAVSMDGGMDGIEVVGNVMLRPPTGAGYPTVVARSALNVTARGNTLHDSSTKPLASTVFPDNTWLPRKPRAAEDIDGARAAWLARYRAKAEPPPPLTLEDRVAALEARVARLEAR